jgi:hypothetical protein
MGKHTASNDNGLRVVKLPLQRDCQEYNVPNISTFINTLGLLMMGKHTARLIMSLTNKRWHSNTDAVQSSRGADCDTGGCRS